MGAPSGTWRSGDGAARMRAGGGSRAGHLRGCFVLRRRRPPSRAPAAVLLLFDMPKPHRGSAGYGFVANMPVSASVRMPSSAFRLAARFDGPHVYTCVAEAVEVCRPHPDLATAVRNGPAGFVAHGTSWRSTGAPPTAPSARARKRRMVGKIAGSGSYSVDRASLPWLRGPVQPCRTPLPRPSSGEPAPLGPAAAPRARLCAASRERHRRTEPTARPACRGWAPCRS